MHVSVIIPTYNRLWSLPEAVASCRPGSEGVEIIVVDDGSTDGTWEWLSAQPDIVAIRQPNSGKTYAVNLGFEQAKGEFVRFLDSDDILIDDANDAQYRAGRDANADVVVAGYAAWYEAGDRRVAHEWRDCGDFLAQQLGECDSSHYSAYLFRRSFVQTIRHRPEFAFRDDRMFVIEVAAAGPIVASVAQPTLLHRHHGRGRIQFQPGQVAVVTNWQELQMYRRAVALLTSRGLLDERRKRALSGNLWALALRILGTHPREGRAVRAWLYELNPHFQIPRHGAMNRLHRLLGFRLANLLIGMAKSAKRWVASA